MKYVGCLCALRPVLLIVSASDIRNGENTHYNFDNCPLTTAVKRRKMSALLTVFVAMLTAACADSDKTNSDHQINKLKIGEVFVSSGKISNANTRKSDGDCILVSDKTDISSQMKPYNGGNRMSLPRSPSEWLQTDIRRQVERSATKHKIFSSTNVQNERQLIVADRVLSCQAKVVIELQNRPGKLNQFVTLVRIEDEHRYVHAVFVSAVNGDTDLRFESRRMFFNNLNKAIEASVNAQWSKGGGKLI